MEPTFHAVTQQHRPTKECCQPTEGKIVLICFDCVFSLCTEVTIIDLTLVGSRVSNICPL